MVVRIIRFVAGSGWRGARAGRRDGRGAGPAVETEGEGQRAEVETCPNRTGGGEDGRAAGRLAGGGERAAGRLAGGGERAAGRLAGGGERAADDRW